MDITTEHSGSSPPELLSQRAAKSGGFMFIAKGVRFGFLLLVNFILINLLLPADFGMVRYVLLIVGVANLINEMGLTTAIVQRTTFDESHLPAFFLITALWGVLLYALMYLAAPLLSGYFATPELTRLLRVGSLMIPITSISAVHRAWLRRSLAFGRLALIEMSAAIISAVVSVLLAWQGFGVWALVAGYLVFEGTISTVLIITCQLPKFTLQPFRMLSPVLFFGMAIVGSRSIDYLLCNAPFFIIGKAIGKVGLGLFSVANDMAVFPQMAINAVLGHVIVSTFARVQTDPERVSAGFSRLLSAGAFFTLPLLLIMIILPAELLSIICQFNKDPSWLDAAPLLQWLAAMGLFYVFTTFSNSVWLSQGKIKESVGVSIVMCLTILVAIFTGVRWGLDGICKALFIRSLLVFPLFVYFNYKISGIAMSLFYRSLAAPVVAGVFMGIIVVSIRYLLPGTTLERNAMVVFLSSVLGLVLYAGFVRVYFPATLESIMGMILPMLPRNLRKKFTPAPVDAP